jgi:hypothetical protein
MAVTAGEAHGGGGGDAFCSLFPLFFLCFCWEFLLFCPVFVMLCFCYCLLVSACVDAMLLLVYFRVYKSLHACTEMWQQADLYVNMSAITLKIRANMAHQCICACEQVCPSVCMHIMASIDMHIFAIMSTCECPRVHTYKNYGPALVHISTICSPHLYIHKSTIQATGLFAQKHKHAVLFTCTKA